MLTRRQTLFAGAFGLLALTGVTAALARDGEVAGPNVSGGTRGRLRCRREVRRMERRIRRHRRVIRTSGSAARRSRARTLLRRDRRALRRLKRRC